MKKSISRKENKPSGEAKLRAAAWLVLILFTVVLLWYTVRIKDDFKEPYKIAFIPKTIDTGNDFWTSLTDGAKLAAKENGIELYISGAKSEQDVEGQIKNIKKVIDMKPDALIIAPCSYTGMTDILNQVIDKNIKLILIDSVVDADISDAIVATDNFLAGKQLGEYASSYIREDAEIGIMAHVKGSSTAMQREAGIKEGLGKKKKNVVETEFCGSSYDKAYDLTKSLIENNPDINVIFGTNEYASVGAARAIQDMGREDIDIYGFDNSIEEIKLLEQGVFNAIIIQKPFNMGYLGVKQAVSVLEGEKIEKNLDSVCKLIDKNNMYEDENQRLLYPFIRQK